jgi:hypothetical protein
MTGGRNTSTTKYKVVTNKTFNNGQVITTGVPKILSNGQAPTTGVPKILSNGQAPTTGRRSGYTAKNKREVSTNNTSTGYIGNNIEDGHI